MRFSMHALNSFDLFCVCVCVCVCACMHALDFKLERPVGKLEGCLDGQVGTKERGFLNFEIIFRDGYVRMIRDQSTLADSWQK